MNMGHSMAMQPIFEDFPRTRLRFSSNVKRRCLEMLNESMVSLVSRRYMRGENGTESLVV